MAGTALRCLSVRQPWAWAICVGEKTAENRTQATPYRGPVAIHASTSKQGINHLIKHAEGKKIEPEAFSIGAVIGIADLVDVVPLSESLESNPWAEGPFCWMFENARLLAQPIPFKGKLNLYSLPDDIAAMVHDQLGQARRPSPESIKDYIDAIKPNESETLLWRAENYGKLGLPDDVIRLCNEVVQHDPANGWAFRMRGYSHCFKGQAQECLADCESALTIDPNDANAYYILGIAYDNLGDKEKSEWNHRRAVELDPTYAEIQQEDKETV